MFTPGLTKAIEFFTKLHNSGHSYSDINTARWYHGIKFGKNLLVCILLKGIFELKSSLPKHIKIWDVRTVLQYLKQTKPLNGCTLKDLTMKLTMLLCLITGQRCQTIHVMDINRIQMLADRCQITIVHKLKHTKVKKHQTPLELFSYSQDSETCIVEHLRKYFLKTEPFKK